MGEICSLSLSVSLLFLSVLSDVINKLFILRLNYFGYLGFYMLVLSVNVYICTTQIVTEVQNNIHSLLIIDFEMN